MVGRGGPSKVRPEPAGEEGWESNKTSFSVS